jgi:hypothetical protein
MKYLLTIIVFIAGVYSLKAEVNGCNFAITNSTTVGAMRSFTVGQGPWGPRKYTWNFGDGTNYISYSTPTNSVYATHTFSLNGVYSMTINAQDSLGGGCLAYMIYSISITGITPTCQAQFAYSIDTVNCKIQFTNQSTPGTSYSWLFSNGGNSAATNPTVSIANQSAITVTLNALNSGQQCGTSMQTIAIAQNKCYTVGLKNNTHDEEIMISNRTDEIEIVFGELMFNSLSVVDSKGLVVTSLNIDSNFLRVQMSQLPHGIYYLLFKGSGRTATRKIIR